MRIKVLVGIPIRNIAKLEEIGESGIASSGYGQDFEYCLDKAIEEFIKKYEAMLK